MTKKKKRLPKILIVIVVLIILGAVWGNNNDENSFKRGISDGIDAAMETSGNPSEEQTTDENGSYSSELPTIKETVLVDQEQIKITALEYVKDRLWGQGIQLQIKNNSNENIAVTLNSMSVNNYMVTDDLFYCDVAAGKTGNDTIYLSDSFLKSAGIETVADIVMDFRISSSDTYETLFDVKDVELPTDAFGSISQPSLDEGKELYNQDGIRIIAQYVDENSFWGTAVELFIENTSDKDVLIQCDNMSINNFMVEGYFSLQVNSGKMAVDAIDVLSTDLEKNNIDQVNDVELNFKILNPNNFETIAESGAVTFHVE